MSSSTSRHVPFSLASLAAVAALLVGAPALAIPLATTEFSIDFPSPDVPLVLESDVLAPGFFVGPPPVVIPAAALGLAGLGVDELDGWTHGAPFFPQFFFSVDRFSVGIPGPVPRSDVATEAAAGQAAGDVFASLGLGANILAANQDVLGEFPIIPSGVPAPFPDDLDGLDLDQSFAGPMFTLGPVNPYLVSGADILGPGPAVLIPDFLLGLVPGADDIDALHFDPFTGDVYFSLAPGSPSLGAIPNPTCPFAGACSPADIFIAPGPPAGVFFLFLPAGALGLAFGDNVNAFAIFGLPTDIDSDGDGWTDLVDNCTFVPNPTQCDSNGDGFGNKCDSDYNNDGAIAIVPDFSTFLAAFSVYDADADSNCDGAIGIVPDFADFLLQFTTGAPGPSGMYCAGGPIPCP